MLTDVQFATLDLIDAGCKLDRMKRAPTIRSLAAARGVAKSTVFQTVEQLKTKGLVDGEPSIPRSLSVTDLGRSVLKRSSSQG